ncbi:MAG: DUF6049 family protein, partial [Actinobacteria bacterium]|nr:DUF6049 family protein [Actinomycetota bacterium]
MPAPRTIRRAAVCVALVGLVLSSWFLPSWILAPAGAQTPPALSLTLVGQPVWHRPDDLLSLRLRVHNDGPSSLRGFNFQIGAYSKADSRSELHENFEVDPLRILSSSSFTDERHELEVAAGSSTVVEIDAPISNLTSLIAGGSGVYPVTITLTDVDGFSSLDSITTQVLYFAEEVEVPLNVVILWPLMDVPSRRAGGMFVTDDPETGTALATATAPGGWLTGVMDAIESSSATDEFRSGLAPGPRLVEELADMSDGYQIDRAGGVEAIGRSNPTAQAAGDAVDRLQEMVSQPQIQPVHMPYAFPDLTAIDDFEQLSTQLGAAHAVLEDQLAVSPDSGWLFAPGGRLDQITLERLHSSGAAASTFFSADSLEPVSLELPSSCRQDFLGTPYTCPITVPTATGRSHGFVLDPELQQRFGALVSQPANPMEMQKLFAELAMIWAELPGTSDRVIALAVPPMWHPPPWVSERFVRTMSRGPWVQTRTPREGLHLGIGAVDRQLVADLPHLRTQPDETYLEAFDDAAVVVESFAQIRP